MAEIKVKHSGEVLDLDNPPKVTGKEDCWTVENLGYPAYRALALAGGYFDPGREHPGYRPQLGHVSYREGRLRTMQYEDHNWRGLARKWGLEESDVFRELAAKDEREGRTVEAEDPAAEAKSEPDEVPQGEPNSAEGEQAEQ